MSNYKINQIHSNSLSNPLYELGI